MSERTIADDWQIVREFTYYPITSENHCWFRQETIKGSKTYHQCDDYGRRMIAGKPFCVKHFKVVEAAVKAAIGRLAQPQEPGR